MSFGENFMLHFSLYDNNCSTYEGHLQFDLEIEEDGNRMRKGGLW